MSKFLCTCGYIIVDQTDFLPYKADFIKDKDYFAMLDSFDEAVKQTFQDKISWADWELLANEISSAYIKNRQEILECRNCGRLWLQRNKENKYVSFLPESGKYEAILDKP